VLTAGVIIVCDVLEDGRRWK